MVVLAVSLEVALQQVNPDSWTGTLPIIIDATDAMSIEPNISSQHWLQSGAACAIPKHGVAAARGIAMSNTIRRAAANCEKHFILNCYCAVVWMFLGVI